MILVLLGTQNNSFNRLLEKIEDLIINKKIKDEVIVQAGYTKYKSKNMKIFDFISSDDLKKLQEKADIVITHGGVGSIVSSLKMRKKVIAVPRKHKYGEHVNDHQKEIVEMFEKKNYIISCNDLEKLEEKLDKIKEFVPEKYESGNSKIIEIIQTYINEN